MRFSVFFLAALALIACASAALELQCSSTLQGVGGALDGIYSTKASVQRPIDCASACAASKDCKSYQYCGFGSFNGTCAFTPSRNGTAPTPAFAAKGDCLLANGTSLRQAPSKPEYGGWTFGVGCRAAEVADAPVEKEGGGEEEEEQAKKPVAPAAPAAAAAAPVAARPAKVVAEPAPAVEEPISALHKPSSARGASAAAPAAVEAGAADPNAPEVVAVAPNSKPAAPGAPVVPATSKAPIVPAAAAAAAATEPKAKASAPAPAVAAAKPAAAKPAAPKAAAAAPDAAAAPAAAVGPAGPGSLSAPVKGYLSGRGASVAELQPGIESATECASICAAAEGNAASACAGYSWCAAAAGCPGNVATGVCQLWSGRAGSGKLSPDEKSGWVSAAREVVAAQPAMKTQTAVGA